MEKPWFGRKKLGWGWGLPQKLQGWIVIILYLLAIGLFHFFANTRVIFLLLVLLATLILFIIAWVTSGKPQWGTWWYGTHKK